MIPRRDLLLRTNESKEAGVLRDHLTAIPIYMVAANGGCPIKMQPTLTEAQRMCRIGELLARGVAGLAAQNAGTVNGARAEAPADSESDPSPPEGLSDDAAIVFGFIADVREVSPADVRDRFGLSRATAYRRLRELEDRGLIQRGGQSRAVKYTLAA